MNSEQPVKDEINIVKYTDPNYKETVAGGDPGAHIPKLIRDGKVAVLYSPGYGAGWYSWHGIEELLFDPILVNMVIEYRSIEEPTPEEDLDFDRAVSLYCEAKYPEAFYGGGVDLNIEWLEQGTAFRIHEYDGFETVELRDNLHWKIA